MVSSAEHYLQIGADCNLALGLIIFLTALCIYAKICGSGNWLTKRATFCIGLAQLFNIAMTLQLKYLAFQKVWETVLLAITSLGFLFFNEFVLWKFSYFYWVTSQNAAVIYHNGVVMYSNLTQREKNERMLDSTVNDKCNRAVNGTYVFLLLVMLGGFAGFNIYWLRHSTKDTTEEQKLIESWFGNVTATWWLLVSLTALRIFLSVIFCRALQNFWKATGGQGVLASDGQINSSNNQELEGSRDVIAEKLKGGDERSQLSFTWHLFVNLFYLVAWMSFGPALLYVFSNQNDGLEWLLTFIAFILGITSQAVLLLSILYTIYWHDKSCKVIQRKRERAEKGKQKIIDIIIEKAMNNEDELPDYLEREPLSQKLLIVPQITDYSQYKKKKKASDSPLVEKSRQTSVNIELLDSFREDIEDQNELMGSSHRSQLLTSTKTLKNWDPKDLETQAARDVQKAQGRISTTIQEEEKRHLHDDELVGEEMSKPPVSRKDENSNDDWLRTMIKLPPSQSIVTPKLPRPTSLQEQAEQAQSLRRIQTQTDDQDQFGHRVVDPNRRHSSRFKKFTALFSRGDTKLSSEKAQEKRKQKKYMNDLMTESVSALFLAQRGGHHQSSLEEDDD